MSGFQETVGIFLGILTLMGSAIAFFVQRRQEKHNEAIANRDKEIELDRQQALERIRLQLGRIIGPMHRLYKTQNTVVLNYIRQEDANLGMDHMIEALKGNNAWIPLFRNEFLQPFVNDPASAEAQRYRNFVSRRLKPVYTRIRELVLSHGSDLDLPTQEEWLEKYDQQRVTSPIVGSPNTNVILDTFVAWTLEFDDILESWADDHDFTRVQPTTVVAWTICNDLVDTLYENAKTKEAKYNKHVTVHKNIVDADLSNQLHRSLKTYRDHIPNEIENV